MMIDWLQQPGAQRLGWTLLHFTWQGAALAALFALLRHALRARTANARYLAGCLTLALMAAAPVATYVILHPTPTSLPAPFGLSRAAGIFPNQNPVAPDFEQERRFGDGLVVLVQQTVECAEIVLPWLVAIWLAGVLLLSLRLAWAWLEVQRLQRRQTEPLDALWNERLIAIQEKLGISRPVRLLKSALVQVPTVIGWFRPVILLPASSLTGLSPAQLELILAHELAHVRRFDYWVNLFQIIVETALFYHPAVWWVSSCIREEREHCCDDLAVKVCGNRLAYARALASLEELRASAAYLALAASGGSLLQRIRHVLGLPAAAQLTSRRRSVGGALLGLGLLSMAVGGIWLLVSPAQYQATVTISIAKDGTDIPGLSDRPASPSSYDPYFIQTESETIQSAFILGGVVQRLQLATSWSQRAKRDEPLRFLEAVELLKKKVVVFPIRNTSLITIRAHSEDKHEAAAIANQIAEVYRESRRNRKREMSRMGIDVLQKELIDQSETVHDDQEKVGKLRNALRVSDVEEGAFQTTLEPETVRNMERDRIAAEEAYIQHLTLLTELKKKNRKELRHTIPTACQDQHVDRLLSELSQAEQKHTVLIKDYSEDHPEVQRIISLMANLNKQIETRLDGVISGLEVQVATKKAAVESLAKKLDDVKALDAKNLETFRPYFVAKRDLETMHKVRDSIILRILQETVDSKLPGVSMVTIVEPAERPLRPMPPNRNLPISLLIFGMLSCVTGLMLLVTSREGQVATVQL
ncbi:MAG: hypothetical protein HY674_14390 [Chloroflexi bacterium]|nr:hypothetical protein [Chloroflexota bacterium]